MLANAHAVSSSVEDTKQFAQNVSKELGPGTLILLKGDLGAGKTTFAKSLISSLLAIDEDAINSPTFTYLNIYENLGKVVYHFDLYRLENAQGFIEKGFTDYLHTSNICIIEWPERIQELLPAHYLKIEIEALDRTQRKILMASI